jgi:NAD(P)-dependent dehydrogenase (short-subunit alcohol dehydrogenase family)
VPSDCIFRYTINETIFFSCVDILVLNAGIAQGATGAGETSKDGYEIVFATNHLGHFAIFQQLRQLLAQSQGRVVTVASMVHKQGRLNLDRVAVADPTSSTRDLYNTSKLCNILFSYELHKRYNQYVKIWNFALSSAQNFSLPYSVGIKSYCLSPGLVKTNLFRHFNFKKLTPATLLFGLIILPLIGRTPEQGAQTVLYCCMADAASGKYYNNCKEQMSSKETSDENLARQLWDYSESLLEESIKKRST